MLGNETSRAQIDQDIRAGVEALQRATEAADKDGHEEAVFYLKAALAGVGAAKAVIATPESASDRR